MATSSADHISFVSFDCSGFRAADNREEISEGVESLQHLKPNPVLHQQSDHRPIQLNRIACDPRVLKLHPNALDPVLVLLLGDIEAGGAVPDQHVGYYFLQQLSELLLI